MARVYARIAGFALYRWGGEYTWMTTGPVSSGVSEPLPLPTTMIGAILGTKRDAELAEDSVLKALKEKLRCEEIEALRGPYYPARSEATILTHLYPGRLLRVELRDGYGVVKGIVEGVTVNLQGTALHKGSKSVSRNMLYAVSLVDAVRLGEVAEPEVSMDALGCTGCSYTNVAKVGGDMRVGIVSCGGKGPLEEMLERVGSESEYYLVVSPILLPPEKGVEERIEKLLKGVEVEIDGCKVRPAATREVERLVHVEGEERKKLVKRLRLRVEILSPGVYGHKGFPRKPMLAIMPGAILNSRNCTREKLRAGLGVYSRLGFGTLIPLQP